MKSPNTVGVASRVLDIADAIATRLARAIGHARCGAHSGFRPCCITFFVSVWMPFRKSRAVTLHERALDGDRGFFTRRGDEAWDYVPCPVCLLFPSRRSTVLACPDGSHERPKISADSSVMRMRKALGEIEREQARC